MKYDMINSLIFLLMPCIMVDSQSKLIFVSTQTMVYILDGCSEHVAHAWCEKGIFRQKKIGFHHSSDVTKCLHRIEIPDLLNMCA